MTPSRIWINWRFLGRIVPIGGRVIIRGRVIVIDGIDHNSILIIGLWPIRIAKIRPSNISVPWIKNSRIIVYGI